jgi:phytoene dehydrogenase-like protein
MERLTADLDQEFPGIAEAIVHREVATAETLAHHLNPPEGAVYGFAPERNGANPLAMRARTTIEGLWLASAYVAAAHDALRATQRPVRTVLGAFRNDRLEIAGCPSKR